MRAVDTNVVVRYMTADDESQFALAKRLIENESVYVPMTVILETEWVLRYFGKFPQSRIADALLGFAGLPTVTIEDPVGLSQALAWVEAGVDLADALHLARSRECADFVTFDKALAKRAKNFDPTPVTLLGANS